MQIENWMGRLSRWGSFFKVLTMVIWSVKTEFIPIQRCFLPDESVISLQLHGFGDGSEVAYAAAVYLGVEASQGVYVYLLMNKSRVVPLSKQTISRTELLASLVLSRLIARVCSALLPLVKIYDIYFWKDSTTTLHWIKGVDKEYKQFVEKRVNLSTRGIIICMSRKSRLWWVNRFRFGNTWVSLQISAAVNQTVRCVK